MDKPQTNKVVFLGDQSVGKTSIINRIMYEIYEENDHVDKQNATF
jgi:GTPase SAR1 family protein